MSLEKSLELNSKILALNTDAVKAHTAATTRLADLMEKFKPQPCTKKTRAKVEDASMERILADVPRLKVVEEPKAEEPEVKTLTEWREVEEPKAEEPIPAKGSVLDIAVDIVEEGIREQLEKVKDAFAEEPKAEEPKEITLTDLRSVAKVLLLAGDTMKADAKAAIAKIAGDSAKISTMDSKFYPEVFAALKALQATIKEA
jgi:hypothetical protein